MLKQPIRIFQITGKQVINDKVIRFFLHDDIVYADSSFNLVHCANIHPYSNYQVGEHLGISIGEIEKSGYNSPTSQEVFNDKSMVNRVLMAPDGYNGFTFGDLIFGRG
jgi:hypothetical protein